MQALEKSPRDAVMRKRVREGPYRFAIWARADGTPVVELPDGTYVAFDAHDLISDAMWFIETGGEE